MIKHIDHYNILNRSHSLFKNDIHEKSSELNKIVSSSTFLVLGGAGAIGQAIVKEIFR